MGVFASVIKGIRAALRGEPLQPAAQRFEATASRAHGHVQAVALTLRCLGFAALIASKPCEERDRVLAMVASRILAPHTKLATTRWWHTTTLAQDFGVADADEDDLYELTIDENAFSFTRRHEHIAAEAALDGIYIIRTSAPATQMDAPQCVRNYKSLANVERAFRSLKTIDLKVRPIHHRTAERVRAHIFLCMMLAYYVEWHMREAWRELMFADEDQDAKQKRDPVAPAVRSAPAKQKARSHILADGSPAHGFRTLIEDLATIVRNTCRVPGEQTSNGEFTIDTTPSDKQQRALELLETIAV